MNSKITIPIIIVISVIITATATYSINFEQPQVLQKDTPEIIYIEKETPKYFEGSHDIKKVSSQEELKNILEASSLFEGQFFDNRIISTRAISDNVVMESDVFVGTSPPVATPQAADKTESDGSEYSTTNVQVENVDEPDYLKNDSKYVYIVSQNTLSIIDAYPAESAKLVLKIALDIESQYI